MSRFLFTVWPYPGHLNPTLAVARALVARGHEAAFYTGAVAGDDVTREGWTCFPFVHLRERLAAVVGAEGTDADGRALYMRVMQYQTRPFRRGSTRRGAGLREVYSETILGTVPAQVDDLRPVLHAWRPDVVVTDPDMWGPLLVLHELDQVPVGVFSYYAVCLVPGRDTPPLGFGLPSSRHWRSRLLSPPLRLASRIVMGGVRRGASAVRGRYGLPPLRGSITELMGRMPLHLVASVPEFDYGRRDLPPSVHYVGPCATDAGGERGPEWLGALPDPLVYVSEGTTYVNRPLILEAAAHGLAGLPGSVLMTTGRHREPDGLGLGALPANMRLERWVPHSAVLARASVFVTHGGAVSVLGGLSAGVPLVVVPLQWEQADNAQRVVEAGVGVRLDPRRCTPPRLRKAVLQVLGDDSYRQRARTLARTLRAGGGPGRAAELLEQLAARSAATSA
jgi:MGT family glycosyltransferase